IPAMRGIATKSPSWTLLFGGGEVEERHTRRGAVHDLLPDRGRDGSPEDLTGIEGVADREVLQPGGLARVIRCADPYRGGQLRGVAGEPGLVGAAAGQAVACRTGLAGRRASSGQAPCACGRALGDDRLEDLGDTVGDVRVKSTPARVLAQPDRLVVVGRDGEHRGGLAVGPT